MNLTNESRVYSIDSGYEDGELLYKKFIKLSNTRNKEVFSTLIELFLREPTKKGRQPQKFESLYNRLSVSSKKVITELVNRYYKSPKNMDSKATREKVATNNILVIDFKKNQNHDRKIVMKPESFVAYETNWSFGLLGYLRHKFNCRDKSRENLNNLIKDMNTSLSLMNDEQRKLFKQTSFQSCFVNKDISLSVTEGQKKILKHIQDTCESELLIDLCNDFQIKVVNNWNVSLVFIYKPDENTVYVEGNRLDVENYLAKKNAYF